VPDNFKSEVVTVKIDKAAIKQAFRGGDEVPGVTLIQVTRLAILSEKDDTFAGIL
jgi:hypothetical protein